MSDDNDTKTVKIDDNIASDVTTEPKLKTARVRKNRSPKNLFISLASIVGTVVVLAIGAASGIALDHAFSNNNSFVTSTVDGNTAVVNQSGSIASVAAKVSPSVVSVLTQTQASPSTYGAGTQEGAGTGIIVSKDGYVMTNNHVVDGATSVTVVDSTGQQYDNVTVIGRDPLNDIAFLKINSSASFTPATLGNSATISVGEQVIAIGNALGQYSNTVTSGIISGTGRPVTAGDSNGQSTESLTDLIQTDASINAGNSGGPLVNLAGQVIGINTATVTGANGIGFSIPINSTKGVLQGVLQSGKISRAFLGLSYLNITPDVAKQFNLSAKNGAYVYASSGNAVSAGSPADKAGLKSGDIITKIDNYTVGTDGGLSSITGLYQPGQTATITYLRGGSSHTVQVTFSAYGS